MISRQTGTGLEEADYRKISYVNDINRSNEEVLYETVAGGNRANGSFAYRYGIQRESYSYEAAAITAGSRAFDSLSISQSGSYYYDGYGSVSNLSAGEDSISYGKSSSNCTELVPYYPANNGAVPGTEKKIYLMAGDKIDRFGGKKGKFFSPTGTPMEMRALPYDADLSQYRQFEVVKPFEVEASTIAPAFGNIGLGTQYRSSVSVDVLLKKGIIKQVGGN